MKEKIIRFLNQCLTTITKSPVEMALALYLFVTTALLNEEMISEESYHGWLVPLFFSLAYICNRIFRKGPLRIVYYVCGLGILPFWWVNTGEWVETTGYFISLIIGILAIPASLRLHDNKQFVGRVMNYIGDAASAVLLSGVAWLMVIAIYFSVTYIFNLPTAYQEEVIIYSLMTFFMLIMPLIFLTFDREEENNTQLETSHLLDLLINYVITPALLIYTVILYLYFAVITLTWSLPKGGIAYMVFAFTIIAVIVKAILPQINRRYNSWYYNHFSYISLPALIMFWIGVVYRVNQYGYTENRIYLILCGGIMTLTVLLFLFRRTAHYQYIMYLSIAVLALFTYIPGFTAQTISLRSQTTRAEQMIRKLGLANEAGRLIREKRPVTDSVYKDDYRQLFEAMQYLNRKLEAGEFSNKYGIEDSYDLQNEIIPDCLEAYVQNPQATDLEENTGRGELDKDMDPVPLYSNNTTLDIAGYKELHTLSPYKQNETPFHYTTQGDTLYIKDHLNQTLFSINTEDMLTGQLAGAGYTLNDSIPADTLEILQDRLLQYENDTLKLILSSSHLERKPKMKHTNISVSYLLVK